MTKDCKHDYDIVSYTDLRRVCRLCKEPMPRPSDQIRERSEKLFLDWYHKLPPSLRHELDAPDFMRQAILEYLDQQAGFPQEP